MHTEVNRLTPNGHNVSSCRSEVIAKCQQIAANARRRGEFAKAEQFIALANSK